ncbi:hypothetical protein I3842_15G142900 [Carya illinoinensis]|uniref:Uncharacterized protein n=1 Tax=Carya illinoinensis TaxID=32201 RepID=A0A922A7K4_CARIL|nr:hypothetical protein I3842_15G142900 [Carya illinoinensis]
MLIFGRLMVFFFTVKPFVNGGTSCMLTTCVIQPIDMIKVRIQLG